MIYVVFAVHKTGVRVFEKLPSHLNTAAAVVGMLQEHTRAWAHGAG